MTPHVPLSRVRETEVVLTHLGLRREFTQAPGIVSTEDEVHYVRDLLAATERTGSSYGPWHQMSNGHFDAATFPAKSQMTAEKLS
jgi:hypothetical protein